MQGSLGNMLFVLAGPSYVGKKTAVTYFMTLYSFSSIVPYTTKPKSHRTGEIEGIHYHYAKDDEINNDEFIFDRPFDTEEHQEKTIYAYKKRDLQRAIESPDNFIIHASTGNVQQMYKIFERYHTNPSSQDDTWTQQIYFIFLNFDSVLDETFFRTKIPQNDQKDAKPSDDEGSEEPASNDETRRYNHAKKEIKFYNENREKFFALVQADDRFTICEKLVNVILDNVCVRPTSPDRIPGPLSDVDIIHMTNRDKDPIKVRIGGVNAQSNQIKDLLCGCGLHLSLDDTIRVVKTFPVGRFIDMAEEPKKMKEILGNIYQEKTISNGYLLRPQEMILCSSVEYVEVPSDVYAMVMSKFSYAQLGLSIELSPNIIQGGHKGSIHFQIKNNTRNYIWIYPNIQVAQAVFFRTIQQSKKDYHEDENHSYDEESSPPLSKFREKNDVLDAVPKAKAVISVIRQIPEWIVKHIFRVVGIVVLVIFAVIVAILPSIQFSIQFFDFFISIITNDDLSPALYVILLGITCAIASAVIDFLGLLALNVFKSLRYAINKAKRKE